MTDVDSIAHPSSRAGESPSRRQLLVAAAGAAVGANLSGRSDRALAADAKPATRPANDPFGYCLNTSTVRGGNLGIDQAITMAAEAGFQAVEPWISELDAYVTKGGSLSDLGKRLADLGLAVPSAIGFAKWIVDDEAERAKGVEQLKRDMEKVKQIGGTHIAAPPSGANGEKHAPLSLVAVAERYRAICDAGAGIGIIPEVEFWGPSSNLSRLSEAAFVAIQSGHPQACVLGDVYHMYKGGSDPNGLRLLSGKSMSCIHFNDYPADPPRATIQDANRIYPGDGIAPLSDILRTLREIGFRGYLSLELFNRDYWKQSPAKVAREGIEKMRACVQKAFAS